jgi:hypothetical protein
MDTLIYMGDHPGLRQEKIMLSTPFPKDKLYLELTENDWMPLYHLVSVQYCPACKARETYMVDRLDSHGARVILKSFERGHTRDNDDAAKQVGLDFEHWIRSKAL